MLQSTISDATTGELIAIHDIAGTLADVLAGLSQAPRCTGPAAAWATGVLEGLYEARGRAAKALLLCTDENRMRASVLVESLEWAMEDGDSAAILKLVQDVAARPGVVTL